MKARVILFIMFVFILFVLLSCVQSELSWRIREGNPQPLRQAVGLPSIAVGNLNPAARNPGLEIMCTGFYDVPGGYCDYFAPGVPFVNFTGWRIGD